MISDAITMLSESIANNDFLGVKIAKEVLDCTQKSYEKDKTSRKNLKKKRDRIGKKKTESSLSKFVQRVKVTKIC